MKRISRRQALVGGGAAVAAGTVVMPRRAKAAGELTVWWTQGFYKAENDAVITWMADWEKKNNTKVNLTIASKWVGHTYGGLALTIEMPFKDNADLPDPERGWSGARSRRLGADTLVALLAMLPSL